MACFAVVINLVPVLPWYIPPSQAHLKQPYDPVKLLFANVESTNKNFSAFIGLVIEENPDAVIIQEATEPWIDRLKVLK